MGLLNAETIVISRTDKLGDFIVSIPSYATCKAMFPQSKIVALTSKFNTHIARTLECIDEVINIDDYDSVQLVEKLRNLKPDVFVALKSDNVIAKLAFKSGAKRRIGPLSKPLSFLFYNNGVRQKRSQSIKSEAEYNLDLIKKIDEARFDEVGIHFSKIKYSNKDAQKAQQYLQEQGLANKNFIAFFPVPGGSNINFRPAGYAHFINSIMANAQKYNHPHGEDHGNDRDLSEESSRRHGDPNFVLVGQPDAQDKFEQIKQFVQEEYKNNVHFFLNNDSILVAAALIDQCKCCFGPSTGTVHIAGNFHKSAVVFYGTARSRCHTRWQLFGDVNEVHFTINDDAITDNVWIDDLSSTMFNAITSTLLEEFYRY